MGKPDDRIELAEKYCSLIRKEVPKMDDSVFYPIIPVVARLDGIEYDVDIHIMDPRIYVDRLQSLYVEMNAVIVCFDAILPVGLFMDAFLNDAHGKLPYVFYSQYTPVFACGTRSDLLEGCVQMGNELDYYFQKVCDRPTPFHLVSTSTGHNVIELFEDVILTSAKRKLSPQEYTDIQGGKILFKPSKSSKSSLGDRLATSDPLSSCLVM